MAAMAIMLGANIASPENGNGFYAMISHEAMVAIFFMTVSSTRNSMTSFTLAEIMQ
mgnify:CR=1 FL=1